MRILLLAPELFTTNGGIPRILRLYARALSDLPGKAHGFSFLSLGDHLIDSSELRRYTTANLDNWAVSSGHRLRFVRRALRWARRHDHVICGHIHLLPVALAMKALNPSLTFDLIAHGIEVWTRPSLLQRTALRFVRQVLCVSDYTRQRLCQVAGLKAAKTKVLHNGLDCHFEIQKSAPPPAPGPLLLTVSRLCKEDAYKGIDLLIEAMPEVLKVHPEARLRIIGRGDDMQRLRRLADRLCLGPKVEMPGFVSDSELSQNFRECTLFALPSTGEGFGLVFLEAMAQGRPCLGARAGGVPEVISPASGVLVAPGDAQAVAEGLLGMLQTNWDPGAILSRAQEFSYGNFRDRLHAALPSKR